MKESRLNYTLSILLILGLTVTVLTLFIPHKIQDNSQLQYLNFGLPFPYVTQDSSRWPFGGDGQPLPNYRGFLSPWEIPTGFNPVLFIMDAILWAALFGGVGWYIVGRRKSSL